MLFSISGNVQGSFIDSGGTPGVTIRSSVKHVFSMSVNARGSIADSGGAPCVSIKPSAKCFSYFRRVNTQGSLVISASIPRQSICAMEGILLFLLNPSLQTT